MKYTLSKRHEKQHGKPLFFLMLTILVVLFILGVALKPPEFNSCSKGEVSARCACPVDQKYIGKRNIVFVDVTDSMSKGKVQDINRLISETAFREMGLFEWIGTGKKIEKTSVYLLADKKPVDMEPIGSYCSLPPSVTWLVSEFSENEEKKIKEGSRVDIINAIDKINSQNSVTYSHIVEGLAVSTSNSSNWMPGSKLILISDLYENSDSCGYFESQSIPSFKNIGTQCRKWVEILGQNLTKNSGQNGNSTVAVCQILSKKPKDGLIAFWRDLFQSQLNYDIDLSCDPQEINQRAKSLN
jgi:hypothetical protein